MPRKKPRRVEGVGPFDQLTHWRALAYNAHPSITVWVRVVLPAGGGHKSTELAAAQIAPTGSDFQPLGEPPGARIPLPAGHRLYATVFPPIHTAGVRFERAS